MNIAEQYEFVRKVVSSNSVRTSLLALIAALLFIIGIELSTIAAYLRVLIDTVASK